MPKNFKWLISLLAGVVTLAILFGGQTLWLKYAVAKPLDKFFYSIDGVENVQISDTSAQLSIDVTLKDVKELPKTYDSLSQGIRNVVGNKNYKLVVHDSRNSELEGFYQAIHYYVQEAIATGRYSTMVEQIKGKADSQGIKANVWVDAKNVYLQLEKNGVQMYEIVPRPLVEVK